MRHDAEGMKAFDRSVPRRISGFRQDRDGHWVADLECGHSQHVRHGPPWQSRPWVVTPEGRESRVGEPLDCVQCPRRDAAPPRTPAPGSVTVHRPRPVEAAPPGSTRRTLTSAILVDGVRELVARDRDLARIVDLHGPPPLWPRPEGFATLVHIVLEQQVSLASAAALFGRLGRELPGGVTPAAIHALGREGLQSLGVTRQKARYLWALSEAVATGALPLATLGRLSDEEAAERLMRVPGIGPWTASIYLLMALRRPDVWPVGDLALHRILARIHDRRETLTNEEVGAISDRWRPWRAVAARILWHGYLAGRAVPAPG